MKTLSSRKWWETNVKSCDVHRLGVSFWSCVLFMGLGVCLIVFGTTLLDISEKLHVGVGILSLMFLVRAVASVLGAVSSGVLMDWLPQFSYTMLCFIIVGGMASTVVVPLSINIGVLAVIMFLYGLTFGSLNNGVHTVIMRMWGDKSGPCMQFLHFAFAFGAFIAPLISKPFIRDLSNLDKTNQSLVTNLSCANESLIGSTMCSEGDSPGCTIYSLCMDVITDACNSSAYGSVDVEYDPNGSMNCSISSTSPAKNLQFGWAYWIAASFLFPSLLAFIYLAVRHDCCKTKHKGSNSKNAVQDIPKKEQDLIMVAESTNMSDFRANENGVQDNQNESPKMYTFPTYIILFLFMLFYVGTEVSFGSLVFTYAVKSELAFSKGKAATLAAAFWGPFAFTRLFSVVLALLKVRASVMMTMNLIGCLIAVTIFMILPHNNIAIWIVSAVLGASFASIFPTTMTWLSEHLSVSGKATAVLVVGGNLGDILIPSTVGALIGNVSPDSFVYCTFSGVVFSSVLVVILFLLTFIYKRKHVTPAVVGSVRYRKLDEKYGTITDPE